MHKTLKETLTFTIMMVVCMVVIMLTYNAVLVHGFTTDAFFLMLVQFIPTVIIAFLIEHFIVGPNVHRIHAKLVAPDSPAIKHIIVLALLFVTCMAAIMSLYGTVLSGGIGSDFWSHYLVNFVRNWPVALLAQLLVAGPLVRMIHGKLFN